MGKIAYGWLIGSVLTGCASQRISAGAGAYSGGIKSVAGTKTGSTGLFAPFVFPVGLKGRFGRGIPLVLAVDYTPLARTSPESSVKNTYLLTRALVGFEPSDDSIFAFALGPSLSFHRQAGNGQPVSLNNGDSMTVFATPDYAVTTRIYAVNAVVDLRFDKWIVSSELFWQSFLKRDRWNLAALLSLQYQFGDI